jgi:NAD(P)H:quinone oxidoreductase type IV
MRTTLHPTFELEITDEDLSLYSTAPTRHVYQMAEAVAEGAKGVDGADVSLFQVEETLPDEVLEKMGAKTARQTFAHIPTIQPKQLAEADAILFGTPTRFGNMAAQMRAMLDATGGLWKNGSLVGKVGERLCVHCLAAWRPGDHNYQLPYHALASRHGYRRGPIHLP